MAAKAWSIALTLAECFALNFDKTFVASTNLLETFVANKVCLYSVLDSTYPGISFDSNGVSSFYYDYKDNVRSHWIKGTDGLQQLERYCERIKASRNGSEYDCILGLSGGLDSSFMLHTLVSDYGLKPLVFHVDGGWNSEIAVSNINKLVDKLKLDLFTEVIDWQEMKEFQLAMLRSGVPHLDIPQDHAFVAVLYHFAERHNIRTIINGGNIATECVPMPFRYYYYGTDLKQINDILERFAQRQLKSYPFSSVFRHKLFLRYIKGVKVFKPLNFMNYSQDTAIRVLSENYGWRPYGQKHFESRFTRFLEGYWLPERFDFDVRKCQLSSLIFTGQITKGEAQKVLQSKPLPSDVAEKEFTYIAKKLEISADELMGYQLMDEKYYWDYANRKMLINGLEKVASAFGLARRGGAF